MLKKTSEVFGVSNVVLPDSYIDRGGLDQELRTLLSRPNHVALRGESKCGKSWLRQRVVANALVVQCRLGRQVVDIYADALSQLGIRLEITIIRKGEFRGKVTATAEVGEGLISKALGAKASATGQAEAARISEKTFEPVGRDITDLQFIANILKESEKTLVIEDFHYLSHDERKLLAFDLKAMWDYGVFVAVVGVWSQSNMLTYLNPDLTGRVQERAITWSNSDLQRVIVKGAGALKICFSKELINGILDRVYGNVGILQSLVLRLLDEIGIVEEQSALTPVDSLRALEDASMNFAEELNARYQEFARRVSKGIRRRSNSTGIYGHAMSAIMDQSDEQLINGLDVKDLFAICHAREPRISLANLRTILDKFEFLQVDEDGRGLVISYDESGDGKVYVVDRQLLLYRRFCTVAWPWESIIEEGDGLFEADTDE